MITNNNNKLRIRIWWQQNVFKIIVQIFVNYLYSTIELDLENRIEIRITQYSIQHHTIANDSIYLIKCDIGTSIVTYRVYFGLLVIAVCCNNHRILDMPMVVGLDSVQRIIQYMDTSGNGVLLSVLCHRHLIPNDANKIAFIKSPMKSFSYWMW